MSKLKTPREKKAASLTRDRRNAYGQSAKASRKRIPAKKATLERQARHAAVQALHIAPGPVPEDTALALDEAVGRTRREEFKKVPDVPLGERLEKQKVKRKASFGRKKAARAKR